MQILDKRSEVRPTTPSPISQVVLPSCVGLRSWVPVGGPVGAGRGSSMYVSSPQSQRGFSGYVEALGSSSYKTHPSPAKHPPPPHNSLSHSKVPRSPWRERMGGRDGARREDERVDDELVRWFWGVEERVGGELEEEKGERENVFRRDGGS